MLWFRPKCYQLSQVANSDLSKYLRDNADFIASLYDQGYRFIEFQAQNLIKRYVLRNLEYGTTKALNLDPQKLLFIAFKLDQEIGFFKAYL